MDRRFLKAIFFFLLGLYLTNSVKAQDSSFEFWPEVDIWYRLNPAWRLSAFIPFTRYHESQYRDINIYVQADYAWGKSKHILKRRMMDQNRAETIKSWLLRGGFMEGRSIGENKGNYIEDMLFVEIQRRTPIKGGILLSSRFRSDARWLGEESDFSYRLRIRVMIEKEFSNEKSSIVPYVNVEPFWDSRFNTISRTRWIGGATASFGPRIAYEGNLTYQYDQSYNTRNLFAFNLILHVFFESKKVKTL
jgi:hypothetical protein